MSMNGKFKEADQVAFQVKKEGHITLPFFLKGFFQKTHLKDKDVIIVEERPSQIGMHQSCKIAGYGGIFPPMTVYEFVCIKDVEVEDRVARDVTVLKATYKDSTRKNSSKPSDELCLALSKGDLAKVR